MQRLVVHRHLVKINNSNSLLLTRCLGIWVVLLTQTLALQVLVRSSFNAFEHDLMTSQVHSVIRLIHLKAHLLSALPNLPLALAPLVVALLELVALLDQVPHQRVGLELLQGYLDSLRLPAQLEPLVAPECLVPISQQLRGLETQQVSLLPYRLFL